MLHDDKVMNSSNTMVITSKILEAAMLVLLVRQIYEVHALDGLMWLIIHTFPDD